MKIDKTEIKRLADVININVTDEELEKLEVSIGAVTEKLDELLDVHVDAEPLHSPNQNRNVFSTNIDESTNETTMKNVNNFDGEYVHVKKVIGDE